MNLFALIFLVSVVVSLQFNQLPLFFLLALFFLVCLLKVGLNRRPVSIVSVAALAGMTLVQTTFWSQLSHQLRHEHQGLQVTLLGRVQGIAQTEGRRTRFRFNIESVETTAAPQYLKRLSLDWYGAQGRDLQPGQRWRLTVKLRAPRDLHNPGAFDYSGWLFRQRIHALGYVVSGENNQLLSTEASIDSVRSKLASRLAADAPQAKYVGLMQALMVGLRANVANSSWDLLRATGTSHLLAISGLHIGMLAAWGFAIGSGVWWVGSQLHERLFRQTAKRSRLILNRIDCAAGLSLFSAIVYAALAGFTIPTQRALIMLVVVLLVKFLRRHANPCTPIALALIVILLHDPLSPLSAGFWLSFSAVMILLGIGVRFPDTTSIWRRAVLTHLCMGLLMFPLTALFFGQGSLVAPLANLLAIPFVSFMIVPPLMLWLMVWPYSSVVAQHLLSWTDFMLALLLGLLDLMQRWLPAEIFLSAVRPIDFGALICAALLLVLPGIRFQRWLILPLTLPFIWHQVMPVPAERMTISVLETGGDVSAVIRTAEHTVLYGIGGQFKGGRTRVKTTLAPFFQASGIRSLDRLILPDQTIDVNRLQEDLGLQIGSITKPAETQSGGNPGACEAGVQWSAGGVSFALHSVRTSTQPAKTVCVLSVRHGYNHIILAARLKLSDVAALVPDLQPSLKPGTSAQLPNPTLLVVQSDTIEKGATPPSGRITGTISPEHLVFSVRREQRDEFDHEALQMRYKIQGVKLYRTDQTGAVEFSFTPSGLSGSAKSYRRLRERVWHRAD